MGCYTANKNIKIINKTEEVLKYQLPKEIIDIIIQYMPRPYNNYKFACYCIEYNL